MTKKIPKKLMKPMVTKEQWLKFTEVLYEQRHPELIEKRVRHETANQIFAELDLKLITRLHKVSDLKKDNPNTIWCIKEQDYNAIKKQHGVKVD